MYFKSIVSLNMFFSFICSIREKRKTITLESREKRRVEKSRMPRPTKRSRSQAQLETEMEEMGVEVPKDADVSLDKCIHF